MIDLYGYFSALDGWITNNNLANHANSYARKCAGKLSGTTASAALLSSTSSLKGGQCSFQNQEGEIKAAPDLLLNQELLAQ
jgi:hypothetical protein